MRTLLSITADAEAKAEIQKAIEARQAELKPKVEVNEALIPESLRHLEERLARGAQRHLEVERELLVARIGDVTGIDRAPLFARQAVHDLGEKAFTAGGVVMSALRVHGARLPLPGEGHAPCARRDTSDGW